MASSPSKMECVTCDRPIDGYAESSSARYVGAGFCDNCIVDKSIDAATKYSFLQLRAYSFKEYPVLAEIDWKVSEVLRHSTGQTNEAIAIALADSIPPDSLKDARYDLLSTAIALINEGQVLKDKPPTRLRASRRCDSLDKCSNDIVELFHYVSCLSDDVPSCLKKKLNASNSESVLPSPPSYTTATTTATPSSPPPPPPPPPSLPTAQLNCHTNDVTYDVDESLRLLLQTTPGENSISMGEATMMLYPNTPIPSCPPAFFKTPAERRCMNPNPITSSPMNINAPPFFPPDNNSISSDHTSHLLNSTSAATTQSILSPDKDVGEMVIEMQSELRHLKAEVHTYKQLVDDRRLPHQTPPRQSANWEEAENFIQEVNNILEKNLRRSPHQSSDVLNPDLPNTQPDLTPPGSPIHITSPILKAMQSEIEWLITHVAGLDQHIIDLKTELDGIKQVYGTLPPTQPPVLSVSSSSQPVAPAPPVLSTEDIFDIPPPPQFSDVDNNPDTFTVPNVPVSNRFDCLTAEDADIYDVPSNAPSAQAESTPAPTRPAHPGITSQQKKRRPKVSNTGSSMIRDQEIHQTARGLDARCHAFSGRCAEEIQTHVSTTTALDDDVIVLGGGTNNIPRNYVADAIIHIGRLIDHTRDIRPTSHIIIPQMLLRYDSDDWVYLNEKIRRVNVFLEHRCKRDARMHFLPLDLIERGDLYDGLHLDYVGKDKFAAAVADLVLSLDLE